LGRKFITLSVHLIYLPHVRRNAARRAGLSATDDPCIFLLAFEYNCCCFMSDSALFSILATMGRCCLFLNKCSQSQGSDG